MKVKPNSIRGGTAVNVQSMVFGNMEMIVQQALFSQEIHLMDQMIFMENTLLMLRVRMWLLEQEHHST